MEDFLYSLQATMQPPTLFGWYHIMWIFITIIACVLIYIFRNKISRKAVNITILVFGITLVIFEIYKQIIYTFRYNGGGGNSTWEYEWWDFPFQFCSTPMYLMVLAGILRKGKVYDAIMCYLATYALFGGMTVVAYPAEVFCSTIGINIQTMYWHCGMVIMAFLILATKSIELNYKSLLKASIVFAIMITTAFLMNVIFANIKPNVYFNMFYIGPYYPTTLPILTMIYPKVPYIIFLLMYIIGFVAIAAAILSIAILLDKLITNNSQKKLAQTTSKE